MTSLERMLTAMGHREPDRVPFLLPANLHAAKELGLPLAEYFSRGDYVAEGQWRIREKYGHDALLGFFHAALEVTPWGGELVFREDGPPNAGAPPLRPEDIDSLEPPRVADCPGLLQVLDAIEQLVARAAGQAPVMGVMVSPFSLPVMQLGFEAYLLLLFEQPERLARLLAVNEAFAVAWANAQLASGATAISMADPVASPSIVPRELYLRTGWLSAQRTIAQVNGPVATSFASGACLPILDDVAQTGTLAVGASVHEDLAEVKARCAGRLTVMGNLNAIEMRRWNAAEAVSKVREAIRQAGVGGGYVLTDNHGEIPWQVPDEVLGTIAEAVREWGQYPLDWVTADEQ